MERILLLGTVGASLIALIGIPFLVINKLKTKKRPHRRTYNLELSRILSAALTWRSENKEDGIRVQYLENRFLNKSNGYEDPQVRKKFPPKKIMSMSDDELRALHQKALKESRL